MKRLTTEEFIAKARAVHGDKYNYDKVEYINSHTPVTIICPKHGDFPQIAGSHLNGKGCKDCAREAQVGTKEEFVTKARAVHGDKYNYDKVVYINSKVPVVINCPKHGNFLMLPNNHTSMRHGCPDCAREAQVGTKEEFVTKAKAVHGDKYNYDKVVYINSHTPVTITCPKHGDFPQKPTDHLSGSGCSTCKQSHLECQTRNLLEKYNIAFDPQRTFGWLKSNKNYHMYLDFYLPEYNVAIECQGEQHYLAKAQWHFTLEDISEIKFRDLLKFFLCVEHNIPVYYIRYDDNVNERLSDIINKIKRIKPIRQND